MMRKGMSTFPARRARSTELRGKPVPERDPHDSAEARICSAIAALGRLAGIDVDRGEGPEDIDASLIQAAYECNFDDPQCLGGPGCVRAAQSAGTGDVLSARAAIVTRGLMRYLSRRASPDRLREARAYIAVVDDALAWARATESQ